MLKSLLTGILLVVFLHSLSGCVSVSPDTRNNIEKAQEYASLGASYYQYDRMEKALRILKKALELDDESYAAHSVIALVYQRLKRDELAEEHFEQALKYVPHDSHEYGAVRNNYASFLCAQGMLDKAEAAFRTAIDHTLYRTPELALENGGFCFYQHDDLVKAEGYLRQALRRNKMLPRSLYLMADISLRKQQYLPARAFVQRYLSAVEPDSQGLLLGYRIEMALGDRESANKYADSLMQKYPESLEAEKLAEMR